MEGFIDTLRHRFKMATLSARIIYVNIAVFVVLRLIGILGFLFGFDANSIISYVELPSSPTWFIYQPWTIITYMFAHYDVLHILFNMLWLYWFGRLFLQFFSAKHLRGLYLLGGICGGLLYILAYNVFPYFSPLVENAMMVGASASILAIVVATAVREPNYPVQFMFVGTVRLKYVAIFMIILDLLLMTSGNAGGHIAHLGGALAGWWFAAGISDGHDATKWINHAFDFLAGSRKPTRRKPKMKVHYSDKQKDYDYNARKKEQSEEIDRILDKLRKSGYGSLTEEEKKRLFDASKK